MQAGGDAFRPGKSSRRAQRVIRPLLIPRTYGRHSSGSRHRFLLTRQSCGSASGWVPCSSTSLKAWWTNLCSALLHEPMPNRFTGAMGAKRLA